MENYEQKYKEAVKAIKELSDSFDDDNLTNELGIIFPELKESEDERIRKAIIEHIDCKNKELHIDYNDSITVADAIAWLEKQGEQKPTIFIPKFRVGDKLVSTKNPRLTYEVLEVGHINELGNPEYKVEIFTDRKVSNPHNIHDMECYKVDEWAKLIEQNPSWSEEDEKMLLQITQYLISLSEECEVDLNDRLNWLKSLKDRMKGE